MHRYNYEGLAGLSDRRGAVGPWPRLSPQQAPVVAELVWAGPDPAVHGVVRWRRTDLATVVEARFGVTLAERTVSTPLRRLGFVRLSVRPRHPAHDAAAQSAHKKLCRVGRGRDPRTRPRPRPANRVLVAEQGPRRPAGHPAPRLGAQGQPTNGAPRSALPRWAYLFGAACPARGVGARLVVPHANGHAMNLHLAEISP